MAGSRDTAQRVRATRAGRRTGCYIYISGEQLQAAGMAAPAPIPWYRVWADPKRPRFVVNLYREP